MQIMPIGGIFERFSFDAIGPLTTCTNSGNKYILVAVEYSTRYCITKAVDKIDTATITNFILNQIILQFGCPRILQTDNASTLRSEHFEILTNFFKIKHVFSSPYAHGTQGVVERKNQSIESILRSVVNEYGTNWDVGLSSATFAINSAPNLSSKYSPYFLIFGTEPTFPVDMMLPSKLVPNTVSSIKELDNYRKIAIENIKKAQLSNKKRFDANNIPVTYPVNSLVLLKIPHYKPGISKKLATKYVGPFKVEAQMSPVIYKVSDLQNPGKPLRTINVRLMRPYYLRPNSRFSISHKESAQPRPRQGTSAIQRISDNDLTDSDDESLSSSDYENDNARKSQYTTRSGRKTRKPQKYSK
jgi:hypothetical protein